jgi:iron(III) transport system substrate-binding protein
MRFSRNVKKIYRCDITKNHFMSLLTTIFIGGIFLFDPRRLKMKKTKMIGFILCMICLTAGVVSARGSSQSEASGTPLVLYTNGAEGERFDWIKNEAAAAGFNVEIVQSGAGAITQRILAEKNNPIGDVVWGLNPLTWEQLKKEDCLVKWEPAWANMVDKNLIDPDGYYYPTGIAVILLIYNANVVTADIAPKKWEDLSAPIFTDKYFMQVLGSGTSQSFLLDFLQSYKDPNGVLKISSEGWEAMKKFIQNGHIQETGEDFAGNMASGVRPVIVGHSGRFLDLSATYPNIKFDLALPLEGSPYVVEGVAILKGTKKYDEGKKFLDWFGSASVQAKFGAQFSSIIPVQPDALKSKPPETQALINRLHPKRMDWTLGAEMMGAWVEKIELEFVQ